MPLAVTSAASAPSSAASFACSTRWFGVLLEPDVLEIVIARGAGVLVRRGLEDRHADRALDAGLGLAGVDQLGVEMVVGPCHGALLGGILLPSAAGDQLGEEDNGAMPPSRDDCRDPRGALVFPVGTYSARPETPAARGARKAITLGAGLLLSALTRGGARFRPTRVRAARNRARYPVAEALVAKQRHPATSKICLVGRPARR